MSQLNVNQFLEQIRVQQKQIVALQAIIAERRAAATVRSNVEVAKLPIFNGEASRVGGFIMAYILYLRMRMREVTVEEQIQWVLSYVQRGLANVWKENLLEDLELEKVEFGSVGKFLLELKKEFSREDEELVKVSELKKIE